MSSLGNKISKKKVIFLDLDDTLCETEGITPQRLEMAKQALSETINSTLLDSVMEQAISWDPVQSTTGTKGRLQRIKKELKLKEKAS